MKYIALTGATGLLGSYLLKDLLCEGMSVAVFVRSGRKGTARQRIETVLQRFEKQLGYYLPRPIIIESHLDDANLGLDEDSRRWVAQHVDTMLHNAASLEFIHNNKTNEPFKSNVEGTNHVLEFCRQQKIRRFHHVSTAYICGLRNGTVLETELNCGQEFGNAYEESKSKAETAVRQSAFLDSVTIFRPAIIVGDSENGYTPTFHGFYTPLKVLYPLVDGTQVTPEGVAELIRSLGMNGNDEKNFVPVNWISAVMKHIIVLPRWHDRCYHLTPVKRTRIDLMSDALVEALSIPKKKVIIKSPDFQEGSSSSSLIETFLSQMNVYRSYWRNDPVFDRTNLEIAAPHLLCPTMDRRQMQILTQYAVLSNFGWPHPKPAVIPFDVHAFLESRCHYNVPSPLFNNNVHEINFGLQVTGSGGGVWTVRFTKEGQMNLNSGLQNESLPTARLNSILFRHFTEQTLDPSKLLPCDVAWENTDDSWIDCYGNELLKALTSKPYQFITQSN
ncbi:MAG: SDR family oxidoreductase [Planctomycetaceae bacterium]|nr:SDR family oxidoreductase [Planctomycetaceae bacterium]